MAGVAPAAAVTHTHQIAAGSLSVPETPTRETPSRETPGGETPGGETPGGETPGGGDNAPRVRAHDLSLKSSQIQNLTQANRPSPLPKEEAAGGGVASGGMPSLA